MVDRNRLRELLLDRGITQAEVARRIGVSAPGLWKLVHNRVRKSRHLVRLAEELETTPDYLLGKTDNPDLPEEPALVIPNSMPNVFQIDEWDLSVSMEGRYFKLPITGTSYAFSASWLKLFTNARPGQVYVARQIGDAMLPTIGSGDLIMIDTADRRVSQSDHLWAVVYEGNSLIRRIRPAAEGRVEISADNMVIRPVLAFPQQFYVVGRVVNIVHRLMPTRR